MDTAIAEFLSLLSPAQLAIVLAVLWWRLDKLGSLVEGLSTSIRDLDERQDRAEGILEALAPLARGMSDYYTPPPRQRRPRARQRRARRPSKPRPKGRKVQP